MIWGRGACRQDHLQMGGNAVGALATCRKCRKKFDPQISAFAAILRDGLYVDCPHCGEPNCLSPTERDVDLRFSRIALMPNPCNELILTSAPIAKVGTTFSSNMDYVYALGRIPEMTLFQWAYRLREDTPPQSEYRYSPEAKRAALEIMRSFMLPIDELLARIPSDGVEIAIVSVFRAMILGTWTAFEALAGDLWEAALNERPDLFADLGGRFDRIHDKVQAKHPRRVIEKGKNFSKAVFSKIVVGTALPDPGTHHRENYYVKFDALAKIRSAFSCAFKARYRRVDDALCATALDALAEVRHLLVHRAGVADAKYSKASRLIRGCPKPGRGGALPLRGDVVAKLIEPVVDTSIKLISAVDSEVSR
jgi:hypothetical protein